MMKHIKHINEGWIEKIEKIMPKRPKHVTARIAESVNKIFGTYLKNPLIYKIMTEESRETNTCFVRVYTKLKDDFGDGLIYLFSIHVDKGIIYYKALGYTGFYRKDFYGFDDMNYPIGFEEELDEIIEHFAKKTKPFVDSMLKLDNE